MSDIFSGFGSLMKGLSGFMPQDDPNVKLLNAQTELSELQAQETEVYAEIGKRALAEGVHYSELENRLHLVQQNLALAKQKLNAAQGEKDEKERAERLESDSRTCPSCGNVNAEGIKFCQECGAKLGQQKCKSCGAVLAPNTRFCGECGAKQEV
ncbi:MAG TPA: zinc ribbon domain-containing protein [Clostridia bacterium]|nr:zinc ribbon domain-containing protein [Clostridia bacterium]